MFVMDGSVKLILYVLRFVGLFPYHICKTNLRKSRFWQTWSVLSILFSALVSSSSTYFRFTELMGVFQNYKILIIVDSIHDMVTNLTLFILQFILWYHSDGIATSLEHFASSELSSFSDKIIYYSSKKFAYLSSFVSFCLLPANYLVLYIVEPKESFHLVTLLLQYYKITLVLYFINHLRILLSMTQRFVFGVLMTVFKSIIDASDIILNPQRHVIPFHSPDVNVTTPRKTPQAFPIKRRSNNSNDVSNLDAKVDFHHIKKMTILSFQFLRHIRSYVNKGLVPAMLCLLLWLVIATYYLVLWPSLKPNQRFMAVTHFVTAIIPVVTLLETSMGFDASVSHIEVFYGTNYGVIH